MHDVVMRVMMGIIKREAYNIMLPGAVSHQQTPFCSQGKYGASQKRIYPVRCLSSTET